MKYSARPLASVTSPFKKLNQIKSLILHVMGLLALCKVGLSKRCERFETLEHPVEQMIAVASSPMRTHKSQNKIQFVKFIVEKYIVKYFEE